MGGDGKRTQYVLVLLAQQLLAVSVMMGLYDWSNINSQTDHMATQISSVTVQKDDSVQLLKQTLSAHSGLDASHHLHRLELG